MLENKNENMVANGAPSYEIDTRNKEETTSLNVSVNAPGPDGSFASHGDETVDPRRHGADSSPSPLPGVWEVHTLTLKPHGFAGKTVVIEYASVEELRNKLHGLRPVEGYHLDAIRKIEVNGKTSLEVLFINPHAAFAFYTMIADIPEEVSKILDEASQHTIRNA